MGNQTSATLEMSILSSIVSNSPIRCQPPANRRQQTAESVHRRHPSVHRHRRRKSPPDVSRVSMIYPASNAYQIIGAVKTLVPSLAGVCATCRQNARSPPSPTSGDPTLAQTLLVGDACHGFARGLEVPLPRPFPRTSAS